MLKVTAGELLRTGQGAEPVDGHPLMIKVKQLPFSWMVGGLCYVQDPSTLLACDLLAPEPGERILDACAAPGGKTTYMAQLMENRGEIVACDWSGKRLERLQENLNRLGVENTKTVVKDWLDETTPFEEGEFDRILVDAPCTNTGVLRRRIDARWRLGVSDFETMAKKQAAILRAVAPLLKKGGVLVYSSCSLEREENEGVVERLKNGFPGFVESRATLPFRDRVDGAFAAKFSD
jgi:16S rRNA (cytosine967-C5)-methyltransferase